MNQKGGSTYAKGGEIRGKVGKLLTSLEKAFKDKDRKKFNSISNDIHRISDNEGLNKKEYDKWDSIREKEMKYQIDNFGSTYAKGGGVGKSFSEILIDAERTIDGEDKTKDLQGQIGNIINVNGSPTGYGKLLSVNDEEATFEATQNPYYKKWKKEGKYASGKKISQSLLDMYDKENKRVGEIFTEPTYFAWNAFFFENGGSTYAEGGEIPYSKEIYDQNGVLIKVGDRLKGDWKSTRGSGKLYNVIEGVVINSKNYPVPAVGIMLNNGEKDYLKPEYDYSQSRFVLKGRSNDMNIGIEVVGSTYAKGGKLPNKKRWVNDLRKSFPKITEPQANDLYDKNFKGGSTYAEGGTINIPIEVQLQAKAMGMSYPITVDGNAEIDVKEIDRYIDKSYAEGGEISEEQIDEINELIAEFMRPINVDTEVWGFLKMARYDAETVNEKLEYISDARFKINVTDPMWQNLVGLQREIEEISSGSNYAEGGEINDYNFGYVIKDEDGDIIHESVFMHVGKNEADAKNKAKKYLEENKFDIIDGLEMGLEEDEVIIEIVSTYAEGGEIGLDTVKATKLHLGISDSEWSKMSLAERDEMRSQSYKNLKSGSPKKSKGWFSGELSFLNY